MVQCYDVSILMVEELESLEPIPAVVVAAQRLEK